MDSAPAYDIADALRYLATLSPQPPVPASPPPGLQTQPTVGDAAAGLLAVLVRARRPRRILELGTSWGYAACALGHAAAEYGGSVLTLELREELAAVARENVMRAGLTGTVNIRTGDARQIVPTLEPGWGLILQDGSKLDYLPLLDGLVDLLEPQGLLITDDILFPVMDLPPSVQPWKDAIAIYNRVLATHPRLHTAWLTVGDGLAISVKREW